MNRIISFIEKKENELIFFVFFISTLFFIIQHRLFLSWDFTVYVSNAKYWFADGVYFETIRPPLMSILIGITSLFSFYNFGEIVYLILVNAAFCYGCFRLSKKLNIDSLLFCVLSYSPYVLLYGLVNGTELLTAALLVFFLVFTFEQKNTGFLLGLAVLSRYQAILFAPLLLLYRKPKKIVLNVIYFSIPIILWMIFNYITTGNPITLVVEAYANNVLARSHLVQPFNWIDIFNASLFLLPFILFYVLKISQKSFRKEERKHIVASLAMLFIIIVTIYSYATTPFKDIRYLFTLLLPLAYFATRAIPKRFARIIAILLIIIIFSHSFKYLFGEYADHTIVRTNFENTILDLDQFNIKNCSIRSDVWPLLAYYGYAANFNDPRVYDYYLERGEYIVLFPQYGEYGTQGVNESFILHETDDFIILGSGQCKQRERVYHSFLRGVNETHSLSNGTSINIDPYCVLFRKDICPVI